jgi:hypothetical protein
LLAAAAMASRLSRWRRQRTPIFVPASAVAISPLAAAVTPLPAASPLARLSPQPPTLHSRRNPLLHRGRRALLPGDPC